MRPKLTRGLNVSSLRNFYWLKEELQNFCRKYGISASGPKKEITDIIAVFLATGKIQNPVKKRVLPWKN